jgi:flagella synthesis protein FlgN
VSVRPADIRVHLQRLLAEESVQLTRLQELLLGESAVLRGDDFMAIERIGADRHDCTSTLTRIDAERRELCRMLSHDAGRDGFDQLLRWCDGGGELRRQWLANLALARRCKDHNDRNGAVVSVKLNHVQKLLTAIRGGSPSPVYAPATRSATAFVPRELGRA